LRFFQICHKHLQNSRARDLLLRNELQGRQLAVNEVFKLFDISIVGERGQSRAQDYATPHRTEIGSTKIPKMSNGMINSIAVVGMAGRFSKAPTLDQFWQNLAQGVEAVSFLSIEELLNAGASTSDLESPNYVRARNVLDGVELFDAAFFGYSSQEAALLDPQHRVFLEIASEAIERAGYDPTVQTIPIGMFAASSIGTYQQRNTHLSRDFSTSSNAIQTMIANERDFLAAHVSYKLSLTGPSVAVQTACSSSLVAVHLACQSLLNYECDLALAGGVSITVPQRAGYFFQEGGIMSRDGHCKVFDVQADGCVGGDGAGIVVLKRMEDATEEGDHIYAVVLGSAINNDGSRKVGFTAPSVEGQANAISMALAAADVSADTISYVETHGTGTPLGDPIEIAALTRAFRRQTSRCGFCAIGSVKPNIGHLDAAAGIAGLIKTILALEHHQLPASLNFHEANPKIDFEKSPFFVNSELRNWDRGTLPRRAGVSSFGIGGTNAHVILEDPPFQVDRNSSRPCREWHLLPLSAKSPIALAQLKANLLEHLAKSPGIQLADVAYTLQVGRRAFSYREGIVLRDRESAFEDLTGDGREELRGKVERGDCPTFFVFPRLEPDASALVEELYSAEPTFRRIVDECWHTTCGCLPYLEQAPHGECDSTPIARCLRASLDHLASFLTQYALARVWIGWGIVPHAVFGEGAGEYVAACLAGVISQDEAIELLCMKTLTRPTFVSQVVAEGVSNEKNESIADRLRTWFLMQSKLGRRLTPQVQYFSSLSGAWMSDELLTNLEYWSHELLDSSVVATMLTNKIASYQGVFLAFGHEKDNDREGLFGSAFSASMIYCLPQNSDEPAGAALMQALGDLWIKGVSISWPDVHSFHVHRRVPLPTYPFERKKYWLAPSFISTNESRAKDNEVRFRAHESPVSMVETEPRRPRISQSAFQLLEKQLEVLSEQLRTFRGRSLVNLE
jgi:acyl transferase domain-containing protein